jgi:hypothetical protein
MKTIYVKYVYLLALFLLLPHSKVRAAVLFSYDAATGQLPTEQGWLGYQIQATGLLTEPNVTSESGIHANAAIVDVEGESALHLRATLIDEGFRLPTFYYQWTPAQQQALINHGLKFTMVFKGFQTSTGGKGNIRFDFSGGEFESAGFTNIAPNRAFQITGLSSELSSLDENFRTLIVTGEQVGSEFVFSGTLDGLPIDDFGLPSNGFAFVNSPNANFVNSVYFGHSTGNVNNRGTDIQVKSIVMETLGSVDVTGDFDGDGDVDGRDFLIWQRGDSLTPLSAGDLADWQANFGVGTLATFAVIPEPTSVGLLILASVSAIAFGRVPGSKA